MQLQLMRLHPLPGTDATYACRKTFLDFNDNRPHLYLCLLIGKFSFLGVCYNVYSLVR